MIFIRQTDGRQQPRERKSFTKLITAQQLLRLATVTEQSGPKSGGYCIHFRGGAGSPSNTKWPGPRPTWSVPRGILNTVWPQYTNLTDRQDRTDNGPKYIVNRFGANRCKTVRHMLSDRCHVLSVCLSCLSVTLVYVLLWPNGWMDQNETWHGGGLVPGHIVLDGYPAPPKRDTAPNFRSISFVAQRLDGLRCHLVWS